MKKVLIALGLLLISFTLIAAPALAATTANCTVTWTAPQTSVDGSNLADLKEYGVYVTLANTAFPATPTAVVTAPALDPVAGATALWDCKNLAVGSYIVQVDAVDTGGLRSPRSGVVPFSLTAPPPPNVAPSAPVGLQVIP